MAPLNAITNQEHQASSNKLRVEHNSSQMSSKAEEKRSKHQFVCPICKQRLSERSTLNRHMKIHDATTKIFECMVCRNNSQRQKSNWMQHLASHIGQDIPPQVFDSLDQESQAILTGTHNYTKNGRYADRMAKAEAKKAKKAMKAQKARRARRLNRELTFEELWYPICELRE